MTSSPQSRPSAELEKWGFELVPAVLCPDAVGELAGRLPSLSGEAGNRRLLDEPWCQELATSPQILSMVLPSLGMDAVAVRATFFDKTAAVNWNLGWHQDTKIAVTARVDAEGFFNWSEKDGVVHCQPPLEYLEASLAVRIHLDPCDESNGALKVIPGTHKCGVRAAYSDQELAMAKTIAANPGDVILMKPLLAHGSDKATSPARRRVIHIEYCSKPLPDGLSWAYG